MIKKLLLAATMLAAPAPLLAGATMPQVNNANGYPTSALGVVCVDLTGAYVGCGGGGGGGSNAAAGTTGAAVPASASYTGYIGADGNLHGWLGDNAGHPAVSIFGVAPGAAIPATGPVIMGSDGTLARFIKTDTTGAGFLSDATTIPVTSQSALNGVMFDVNTTGYPGGIDLYLNGGSGNATISFLSSEDDASFSPIVAVNTTSGSLTTNITLNASTGHIYIPAVSKFVRVYLSAYTSGTISGTANARSFSSTNVVAVSNTPTVTLSSNAVVATGNVASGATDSGNPVKVGGVYNSTLPTLTTGQRGDLQVTPKGALLVGFGASTGFTGINAPQIATDTSGTTRPLAVANYITNGTSLDLSTSATAASGTTGTGLLGVGNLGLYQTAAPTLTNGQWGALQSDVNGNLKVNIAAGASSGAVAQGSTTSGQTGSLVQCAATTAAPSYTTATTNPVSCDPAGNLRVNIVAGSSNGAVAQASTTAGQSGGLTQGATTTAAPTYTTGTTNPLSLTAAGALRTDSSGTTQPVSISAAVTVVQQPIASASFAVPIVATQGVTSNSAKGSQGNVYHLNITTSTVAGYVILYNSATAITTGTTLTASNVEYCIPVAISTGWTDNFPMPLSFPAGVQELFSTSCGNYIAVGTAPLQMAVGVK